MLVVFFFAALCSLFFYVEAFQSAMNAKKWALAGFIFGPFVFPMFTISQHINMRKARGFQNLYLQA